MKSIIRLFSLSLLGVAMCYPQLTSVTPTSGTIEVISDPGTSSFAPLGQGVRVRAEGTGTWSITTTCAIYGWDSSNLPTYIYLMYAQFPSPVDGSTCNVTINGGSGGSQLVTLTQRTLPRWDQATVVDALGNLVSSLGFCSKGETYYWYPNLCTVQEATSRPGGSLTPPSTYGGTRIDATFGGTVKVYPTTYTSRSNWNQISHKQANGLYYWAAMNLATGTNQLLAINTTSTASNFTNLSTICTGGSNGGIWLDPNESRKTKGYCLINESSPTPNVVQFDFSTAPNVTSDGVKHVHNGVMGGAIGLGNPFVNDGWFAHHDTAGQVCMTNLYDAGDVDYCFTPPVAYYPRSLHVGQVQSRTTGLYYINVASDNGTPVGSTNRNTMFAFHAAPPYGTGSNTWSTTGAELPRGSVFPQSTQQVGRWYPGICGDTATPGNVVDCELAGHAGGFSSGNEPWVSGHGRFQVIYPPYNSGSGGSIKAWLNSNAGSLRLLEQGGGAIPFTANMGDYYQAAGNAPAEAVVAIGTTVDQGQTPAWQITTASCSAGACTANVNGNFTSSGWTVGTSVFIDGFSVAGMNGVKTIDTIAASSFTWTDGTLTATPSANTASVTLNVSRTSGMVTSGIAVCRKDNYFCKILAKPLAISYGDGSVSGASGSWRGAFNSLVFIVLSPDARWVCFNSDYGYMEQQWGNCIDTGMDLSLDMSPNHFDKWGRGLYVADGDITSTGFSGQIKTSDAGYTCIANVSLRSDASTQVAGSPFTATGSGSTKTFTVTGLSSNTKYYVKAKCGQSASRVMEKGTLQLTTRN